VENQIQRSEVFTSIADWMQDFKTAKAAIQGAGCGFEGCQADRKTPVNTPIFGPSGS